MQNNRSQRPEWLELERHHGLVLGHLQPAKSPVPSGQVGGLISVMHNLGSPLSCSPGQSGGLALQAVE